MNQRDGADIQVIDSLCGSLGQGLVVLEAARMAKAGKEKGQIVDRVRKFARHMEHIFTVDDLKYLQRGGRVGRASAFVGSLLSIKPLLHVKNGLMVPIEKARVRTRQSGASRKSWRNVATSSAIPSASVMLTTRNLP